MTKAETPNHALQRTAPAVTLAAPPPSPAQPARQPPPSLSLGSLGRMNTRVERTLLRRVAAPLRAAPPMLLAYTVFAIAVTLTDWLLRPLAPESFQSLLVPYTGWVASMFYAFTIFFAIALIYQQKKWKRVRFVITLQLLLSIAFGVCQFFQRTGETFGNPYLTISPWRPVWTVLIPSIWIVLLHSPRMNRFCSQTNEPRAA